MNFSIRSRSASSKVISCYLNSQSERKMASEAQLTVLATSTPMPEDTPVVRGPDFNKPQTLESLLGTYSNIGFQATSVGIAIDRINEMLAYEGVDDEGEKFRTKIFLGYTSNMVSCGMREVIRYLAQHKLIDCIVTTCGGIEEDFIKCMAPTFMGDFKLEGKELRRRHVNRIGNLLIPNNNYCLFEDWLTPILDSIADDQAKNNSNWTPSKLIERLGQEIKNEESIYYWCAVNDIPVFCPGITDGAIGDMLYFHSYRKDLRLDLVEDIRRINNLAVRAKRTGMIILGGGIIKHHICNANLMRNGADYAVFINTAHEFDGSDAGAAPDEAVSWGKIKMDARPVKVCSDASIVFPLIVSQTFAKHVAARQAGSQTA